MTDKAPCVANIQNFQQVVIETSRSVPVLVDFWADWCQPCHMLMPVLAKLAETYAGMLVVAKVDTEAERELAARFGVRSLPTLKLFKDGEIVEELVGALPETAIRAVLDRHVRRESDGLLVQARHLAQSGDLAGALALAQQAHDEDPDNPRVAPVLAGYQAAAGDARGALQSLDRLPPAEADKPEITRLRARLELEARLTEAPPAETLLQRLTANPGDSEACYQLAVRKLLAGEHETGLELLLSLMQRDRGYGEDAARKALLQAFALLDEDQDLVRRYRVRMFDLLH
jgi:putative thioredoxin